MVKCCVFILLCDQILLFHTTFHKKARINYNSISCHLPPKEQLSSKRRSPSSTISTSVGKLLAKQCPPRGGVGRDSCQKPKGAGGEGSPLPRPASKLRTFFLSPSLIPSSGVFLVVWSPFLVLPALPPSLLFRCLHTADKRAPRTSS